MRQDAAIATDAVPQLATLPDRDLARVPQFLFDELEAWLSATGTLRPLVGNVHGVTLTNHVAHMATATPYGGRAPVVIDLIRHPVSRFQSQVNRAASRQKGDPAFAATVAAALAEAGIRWETAEDAAFHYFTRILPVNAWWAREIAAFPDWPRVTMERLVEEPTVFEWLLSQISGGRLHADKPYLDLVYSAESRAEGRKREGARTAPPSPRECWESWTDAQRRVIKTIADELDVRTVYRPFGYDFSFMT